MDDPMVTKRKIDTHVSVDCVLIGFDGEQLRVLLVRQIGKSGHGDLSDMKLPGSLIYTDEELDDAAKRVLTELTGLKNIKMDQFRAYGSKGRTANREDVEWLERFQSLPENHVGLIVTIAYLSLQRINRRTRELTGTYDAMWVPVGEVKSLAFDHYKILQDALKHIRKYVDAVPSAMYDLLPRKFTASQLRVLYQLVYEREFDIRNFHKKIAQLPYLVPLEEKETGVAHRAARYYRFDKVIYNRNKK